MIPIRILYVIEKQSGGDYCIFNDVRMLVNKEKENPFQRLLDDNIDRLVCQMLLKAVETVPASLTGTLTYSLSTILKRVV